MSCPQDSLSRHHGRCVDPLPRSTSASAASPYAQRAERLRTALDQAGAAGAVLTRPEYGLYLTGRPGGPIVLGEVGLWRLDGLATPPWAASLPDASETHVRQAMQEAGLLRQAVGVETRWLGAALGRSLGGFAEVIDVERVVAAARFAKDDVELATLRSRVQALEDAFRAVNRMVRSGVTELDVALAASASVSRGVGRMIAFRGNLGSGRDCVDHNSQPGVRPLANGESFYLDLYPNFGGYCADLTRCFAVGAVAGAAIRVHGVLERALAMAVNAVRPGVPARAVDAAVRAVFAEEGYLQFFHHHSGHGLGLFAAEPPFLTPEDETSIPVGAVLAIEPGLYMHGVGSFRLEVNVAVTTTGCEVLGGLPPRLLVCDPS